MNITSVETREEMIDRLNKAIDLINSAADILREVNEQMPSGTDYYNRYVIDPLTNIVSSWNHYDSSIATWINELESTEESEWD